MSDTSTSFPHINASTERTPIAIIGMASIFPQSETLQQYWDNIVKEVDCITEVPATRWEIDDYYDPDPTVPDKTYCKRGGFIPDIDFNPMEFGLPPNILEITDVSQLLSLVVAKQALNDAGYGASKPFSREKTGVILGVGGGQKLITPLTTRLQYPVWDRVLESSGIAKADREKIIEKIKLAYVPWEENSFPGMLGNVIAGRIANRLDLGGTNCVVDAACAASLAAVKMAVSELREHRADTMITGGVDTDNSIFMYMSFSKTPAFSRKQDIRPFDAESDGMMIGEGIGMLVLKRLADAERDNDRIYAVIKGIGSSSDGKYKSIYAPRSSGQARALDRAYEDAGVPPTSVGLIEAHGTGTAAGDPTEFAGLSEVFSQNNQKKQQIALGSVKSQIGHTKAAAGAASLIKTALALHHKILPPTLNVSQPNPKMDIENTPFYLNTKTRPWIQSQDSSPRRAGVSAFGFGGTNFHFVLEEYGRDHEQAYRLHSTAQPIFLAAPTVARLLDRCREQLDLLDAQPAEVGERHYTALVEASQTIAIPTSAARVGFVAESLAEARELLQTAINLLAKGGRSSAWEHPKGIYYRQTGLSTTGKVVALFPGQGSQYLNMGKNLAQNFPSLRQAYSQIDGLFEADGQPLLSSVVFPAPAFDPAVVEAQAKTLERTNYAQPAIGAFSLGLYKLLQQAGFQADFAAGHSFGELTALWAGGVISDEDYLFLTKARGQAMAPPDDLGFDAGAMLAVKGDPQQIQVEVAALPNVEIANYNSTDQVVLAGPKSVIQQAQQQLETRGYFVTPLPVSAAFHTPLVGHAQQPFAQAIEQTSFKAPTIPVFSNSTGQAYPDNPRMIQVALEEHILKPVLFKQEIESIYAAGGDIFVEIGPRSVLTNLVKNVLGDRPHLAIATNRRTKKGDDHQLRQAYVQLRVAGLPLRALDPYPHRDEGVSSGNTKKPLMTVKLNGANYVSKKTQAAFETVLRDGHTVAAASAAPESAPAAPQPIVAQPAALPKPHHVGTNGFSPKRSMKANRPRPLPVKGIGSAPAVAPNPIPQAVAIKASPIQANTNGKSEIKPIPVPQPVSQPASTNGQIKMHTNGHSHQKESSKKTSHSPKAQQGGKPPSRGETPQGLEQSMALLHQHQAETLRVHETYLKNQETYSKSVFQLMQQFYQGAPPDDVEPDSPAEKRVTTAPEAKQKATEPPAVPVTPPVASPSPAPTVSAKPVKPVQTPPESPVNIPTPAPLPTATPKPKSVAPPAPAPEPTPTPTLVDSGQDVAELAAAMLDVVSEKTGYPAEMLELEMDMEADLGIDSIKRVEILGAMQERYPNLPDVNPEELAELRTLGQIVNHMQSGAVNGAASSAAPASALAPASTPAAPAPEPAPAPVDSGQDVAELAAAMLDVVSEKTGYPAEMLELEMDMEADLGIDSIKRVEILGAMQERYPNLPDVNPEELAELRTLGQIVNHMQSGAVNGAASSAAPASAPAPASTPAAPAPEPAPAPVDSGQDVAELAAAMLDVVSEKTGYPAEMLELEMDMEADLGIDSIKRVEILGAMQERYPNLPDVNPEELAELRTLGQIVSHMQGGIAGSASSSPAVTVPVVQTAQPPPPDPVSVSNGDGPDTAALAEEMLAVVSEKTGYPAEMLELEMDMEADLGIDSIKRVEILGTMQERHPHLPDVNPEELAEIRTLGGIVAHLGKSEPAAVGAGETSNNATASPVFVEDDALAIPHLEHGISRSRVRLMQLPAADFLEGTLPDGYTCLLTDDGSDNTRHLAESLLAHGWPVTVLSLPQTVAPGRGSLPQAIRRIALDDLSEAHLQQQLAAIGPVGAFIHLNPILDSGQLESAQALVKQIFFIAKHLKTSLVEAARHGRAAFLTIARLDGEFGLSGELDFNPISGGLFGLTKTLSLEWNRVFCRAIDLHPDVAPEQIGQYVLAELHDPNRLIAEVGYGHQGRVTLAAEPVAFDDSPTLVTLPAEPAAITPNSVFVVSGGAKGITAQCVIRLAQQHRCKFILLGRSSIAEVDTGWLGEYADEAGLKRLIMERLLAQGEKPTPVRVQKLARAITSKQEIEATLHAIRQTGGQAEYLSLDVTDAPALQQALAAAATRLGPITGLIHGAGVLSDKLIEKKTEQDFEAVYATKVQGLQALLSSVPPQQLEHLVLFSSAAGFYGNVGQADYALANEILNKTAHWIKHHHPSCHVVSINWGPWDGGMVTPALKQIFAERNIQVIPVDVGTWILANELAPANHAVVQTVVGGPLFYPQDDQATPLRSYRIHRLLELAANPFLQDHVIGQHPVLPTVNAIAWMGSVCEQLYPGFSLFSCDNYQVLKGIVFDEESGLSKPCVLDLEEVDKSDEAVQFKAVVWSTNPAGKVRYHYRAEITLRRALPEAPHYPDADLTETEPITHAELYQNGTLFHGPSFRGVERVLNISSQKLTMRCVLPPIPESRQGQFPVQSFNPYIADGQFQSLVIWARHFHDAGSLPLQAGRGEQYRSIPFGETSYVSMEVKHSTSTRLVADIITHDAGGRMYARVLGAEVTISPQLNHLFVPATSS